jgi:hypothetical protein
MRDRKQLDPHGCRRLALAIILHGVKEYGSKSYKAHNAGKLFLSGPDVERWCYLVDVDVEKLRSRVLDADVRMAA